MVVMCCVQKKEAVDITENASTLLLVRILDVILEDMLCDALLDIDEQCVCTVARLGIGAIMSSTS
jgi:hypothetical protein